MFPLVLDAGKEFSTYNNPIEKMFPPGQAVLVNEFVPPKYGGRVKVYICV